MCEWLSTTLDTFPFRPPFPAPVPHLVVDALPAVQGFALIRFLSSAPPVEVLPAPVPHLVVDALLAVQALKAHASEHKQPRVAAQLQRRAVAALQQGPQQRQQQGQQRALTSKVRYQAQQGLANTRSTYWDVTCQPGSKASTT